jgi:hypothetical protein
MEITTMEITPIKKQIVNQYVTVKYNNKIYKIRKSPQENDEEAYDRAWYIATMQNRDQSQEKVDLLEKECLSHIYVNQKYYNIKYE